MTKSLNQSLRAPKEKNIVMRDAMSPGIIEGNEEVAVVVAFIVAFWMQGVLPPMRGPINVVKTSCKAMVANLVGAREKTRFFSSHFHQAFKYIRLRLCPDPRGGLVDHFHRR